MKAKNFIFLILSTCLMLTTTNSIAYDEALLDGKAAVAEFLGTPTTVSVSGWKIPVYPEVKVTHEEGATTAKLTGHGVRQQYIAFIKLNIYVAAHYMDNISELDPKAPLNSMKNSKARVIQMTMLQNASADEIRTDFEKALDVNGVDLDSPAMVAIRSQLTFNLKSGQSCTLIGYPTKDGQDHYVVLAPNGVTISESNESLSLDFWKTWFGVPVDNEMKKLGLALVGTKPVGWF